MAQAPHLAAPLLSRIGNAMGGALCACAALTGIYAKVFDLPSIVPIAFICLACCVGVVTVAAAFRVHRLGIETSQTKLAYALAQFGGLIPFLALMMFFFAQPALMIGALVLSGGATICAIVAAWRWWSDEPVTVGTLAATDN